LSRRPGIGVLGCGIIARGQHLRHLARGGAARLVAAADPAPAARSAAARSFGVPVVSDAEELVARPDVDALVIATPSALHAEHARLAIAHGKPFYLEKPLATTAVDARGVLADAAARGASAMLGFNYRRQPVLEELRRLHRAGATGELLAIRTLFVEPRPAIAESDWRARRASGGGVWLDLASHHVDLVRWLTGEEIVEVGAAAQASLAGEHDRASARFRLAGGVEVHALFAYGAGPLDRIELVGRRAVAVAERHAGELHLVSARERRYGARRRSSVSPGMRLLGLGRRLSPSWEPSFSRALRAFAAAVVSRSFDGLPGLADGAASLAAVLAAERAAESGSTVAVEPIVAGG
jgi:predicted dehydrogenase